MPPNDPEILALSGRFRINKVSPPKRTSSAAIRRTRTSFACGQCRRAKLRCDRKRPCGSCIRRDESKLCRYDQPGDDHDGTITQSTEGRLVRLESVIKQLLHDQLSEQLNEGISVEDQSKRTTQSSSTNSHIHNNADNGGDNGIYVGVTHWSSVLEEIHEIRLAIDASLTTSRPELTANSDTLAGEVVFGFAGRDTVSDIISRYLPEKLQIDRYLAIYFRGEAYIIPFIHTYHFQKEYQSFWQDTAGANPLWISILFSICYMASMIGGATNSYRSTSVGLPAGDPFLYEAAGKCLVLGCYHKPQRYSVEALAMYGACRNLQSLDPCREAGTIFSIVIRLAYQMGYHREPRPNGAFSTFECEMRRRCWAAIKQMDLMVSFQLGLPSNICMENCDTSAPRNLLDSDFDSNAKPYQILGLKISGRKSSGSSSKIARWWGSAKFGKEFSLLRRCLERKFCKLIKS